MARRQKTRHTRSRNGKKEGAGKGDDRAKAGMERTAGCCWLWRKGTRVAQFDFSPDPV